MLPGYIEMEKGKTLPKNTLENIQHNKEGKTEEN